MVFGLATTAVLLDKQLTYTLLDEGDFKLTAQLEILVPLATAVVAYEELSSPFDVMAIVTLLLAYPLVVGVAAAAHVRMADPAPLRVMFTFCATSHPLTPVLEATNVRAAAGFATTNWLEDVHVTATEGAAGRRFG